MRLTGQVWVAESVSVVSCLTVRLVRRAHLAVGGIATKLEELKYLFRPGTWSLAHGPRLSELLNSVGLPGRPKAGVAPTGPGRREVHLKTGVAQWWGWRPSLASRWLSSESLLPGQCGTFALDSVLSGAWLVESWVPRISKTVPEGEFVTLSWQEHPNLVSRGHIKIVVHCVSIRAPTDLPLHKWRSESFGLKVTSLQKPKLLHYFLCFLIV